MKVLIAGGTGFIGKALVASMVRKGWHVFALTRSLGGKAKSENLTFVEWLGKESKPLDHIGSIDIVINLAGDPINKGRWTRKKKDEILQSRVTTTQKVIELMKMLPIKPTTFINASAIGYYGYAGDARFYEQSLPLKNSFPSIVCDHWENEANKAGQLDIRTVIARIGIVLGQDGGVMSKMRLPYRFFVGGKIASGQQWLSWVHIDDLIALFFYIIDHLEIVGPVNITAPNPVTMNTFGKTISKVMHRPHWLPIPRSMLHLALGEMSGFIINGQHVMPTKALNHGFSFQFTDIQRAVEDLLVEK